MVERSLDMGKARGSIPRGRTIPLLNLIKSGAGTTKMPSQKIKKEQCAHVSEMKIVSTDKTACEVCGETKNLRLCTSCGSVFCCESHLAHNREHFEKTGHSIIISVPTGTPLSFVWCWVDKAYLE